MHETFPLIPWTSILRKEHDVITISNKIKPINQRSRRQIYGSHQTSKRSTQVYYMKLFVVTRAIWFLHRWRATRIPLKYSKTWIMWHQLKILFVSSEYLNKLGQDNQINKSSSCFLFRFRTRKLIHLSPRKVKK